MAEGGKDQAILVSVRRFFRPDDVGERGDRNPNALDGDGLRVALQIRVAARAEFVYGDVYARPGLSDRDREFGAVVALVALGRSSQLPQHIRAALKAGVTPEELREIILQTATVAGFPVAMNACSTLKSIVAECDRNVQ